MARTLASVIRWLTACPVLDATAVSVAPLVKVAVEPVIRCGFDRLRGERGLLLRAQRRRLLVVTGHVGDCGRRLEPGIPGVRGRAVGRLGGTASRSRAGPRSSVRFVTAQPTLPSLDDAQRHRSSLISVGWCTSEPAKRANPDSSTGRRHRPRRPLPRAMRARRARARDRQTSRTPTWTLRKRAGEAPCATCAACPGWPLPQFVEPHSSHASGRATASQPAPEAGVMPV